MDKWGMLKLETKLTQYEVKNQCDKEWQDISEERVLCILAGSFTQITPKVCKILAGEEIITSDEVYRI